MYKLGLNKIYIYEKLFDTITLITVDDIKNWDVYFSLAIKLAQIISKENN